MISIDLLNKVSEQVEKVEENTAVMPAYTKPTECL